MPPRRPASTILCLCIIWYNCTIGVQERDGQVGWRARVNKSSHCIGSDSVHPRWTQVLVHLSKLRKSVHSLLSQSNSHSRHTPGRLGSRDRGPRDFHGIRPHDPKEFGSIDPLKFRVQSVTPPSLGICGPCGLRLMLTPFVFDLFAD